MTREELMHLLVAAMPELRETFGVDTMCIFGSFAREQHEPTSDVDLLVTFSRSISLFGLADLQRRLEEIVGRSVDVGTPDSLRPHLRDRVLHEAIRVA